MGCLYIILVIVGVVYTIVLIGLVNYLSKQYKKGVDIQIVPKGSMKIAYLFFPFYLPFCFLSIRRKKDNMVAYNTSKQEILASLFNNDVSKLVEYENYIMSLCGIFHPCFYSILDNISKSNEADISSSSLSNVLSRMVSENGIDISRENMGYVSSQILSFYLKHRYNESEIDHIIRLRGFGFNTRLSHFTRNEKNHTIKCEYQGREYACPKNCDTCPIQLKTDADICFQRGKFSEAIEKYLTVVDMAPSFAEAWNNLGTAYSRVGDYSYAVDAFIKATDIDPYYGLALWGAIISLKNLGREREERSVLRYMLSWYDHKEAEKLLAELSQKGVNHQILVCRNLRGKCFSKISKLANIYGIGIPDSYRLPSLTCKSLYHSVFNPFFDYITQNSTKVDIKKITRISCMSMFLAGMASAKLYNTERSKVNSIGLAKILSVKGFSAIDNFCCDFLGINYSGNGDNALTPCLNQMTEEAIPLFEDVFEQVKQIDHIKQAVKDISESFYYLGYSYIDYRISHCLPIYIHPKHITKRDLVAFRLREVIINSMNQSEEKSLKVDEGRTLINYASRRMESFYCYSCGKIAYESMFANVDYYVTEINKIGYDCKLMIICKDCCKKHGIDTSNYTGNLLLIRLETSEQYRIIFINNDEIRLLYLLLKNEKIDFTKDSITECIKVIQKILGIKISTVDIPGM